MKKAKSARRILRKIIVQGNQSEIVKLFDEIWAAHADEFYEDNNATRLSFIFCQLVCAVRGATELDRDNIEGLLADALDELGTL